MLPMQASVIILYDIFLLMSLFLYLMCDFPVIYPTADVFVMLMYRCSDEFLDLVFDCYVIFYY